MKKLFVTFLLKGIMIIIVVSLSGCSLMGYGIGSMIDGAKEDYRSTEKWELDEAKRGRKIKLAMKNGEIVKGKYRGLDSLDYDKYSLSCENINQIDGSESIPCPQDSVTIITTANDSVSGKFLGYDIAYSINRKKDSILNIYRKPEIYQISLTNDQDTLPRDILITSIASVATKNNNLIGGGLLREKASSENLPLRSAIKVRIKWDEHQVPVEQVESIGIDSAHHTKYYLMAIGLVIDGCCIALAVALSQMQIGLGSGGSAF